MALRNILTVPDETLGKISRPVTNFDKRLHILLDDMLDTMRNVDGAGLAAVQVGVLRRVCVIEPDEEGPVELINPEIVSFDGEQEGEEGCLSAPGLAGTVKRPMRVTARAFDRNGNTFEIEAEGLKARVICHEVDHLDGKVYIDIATGMRMLTDDEKEGKEKKP